MPMYDWNGTTSSELGKAYDWDGTTSHQLGKGYDYDGTTNHLIYSAQSDAYSITATGKYHATWAQSSTITNTEGYTKMVIENASVQKGNFGENKVELWCNGSVVLSASGDGWGKPDISGWAGKSFTISNNGTVFVKVWSWRDSNRDDYQDELIATVQFHFE